MGCESAAEQTSVSLWEESGGGVVVVWVLVMEGGCGLWEESGWGGASDGGWVWLMGREWVGRC